MTGWRKRQIADAEEAFKIALQGLDHRYYLAEWYVETKLVPAAIQMIAEQLKKKEEEISWYNLDREQIAEILCDERFQGRPELMLLQMQEELRKKNHG